MITTKTLRELVKIADEGLEVGQEYSVALRRGYDEDRMPCTRLRADFESGVDDRGVEFVTLTVLDPLSGTLYLDCSADWGTAEDLVDDLLAWLTED